MVQALLTVHKVVCGTIGGVATLWSSCWLLAISHWLTFGDPSPLRLGNSNKFDCSRLNRGVGFRHKMHTHAPPQFLVRRRKMRCITKEVPKQLQRTAKSVF